MAVLTRTCNAVAYQRTGVQTVSHASLPLRTSTFRGDTSRLQHNVSTHVGQHRQHVVEVQSFKFMKKLGLKKPEFLPDFGKDKRLATLNSFFSTNDKATLESMLSDNVKIVEEGTPSRTYNKSEFINLLCNHVVPAIPDFDWCHATSGENDKEGYAVVTCQVCSANYMHHSVHHSYCYVVCLTNAVWCVKASGQHSGKPLRVPGSELPKVLCGVDLYQNHNVATCRIMIYRLSQNKNSSSFSQQI